ncbi:unnamed protein product, partial [Adineta steineri]
MKYIIKRKSSFQNKKFEISCDSKQLCTAKVTPCQKYNGQYNIILSNSNNKSMEENSCIIEPNSKYPRSYFIHLINKETNQIIRSAQLSYEVCSYNNYLYTIIIGRKLYKVRSCDLKDRRLTIVDAIQSNDSSTINCPKTLFQVIDSFTKSNKKYHVTINDTKWQYIYLAITILLDLHEYGVQNVPAIHPIHVHTIPLHPVTVRPTPTKIKTLKSSVPSITPTQSWWHWITSTRHTHIISTPSTIYHYRLP